MSLVHEATLRYAGFALGDIKVAHYDIAFTLHSITEPETGWLLLNGAIVSRTTYASLFAYFGNTDIYGGGDGSTTFGLPDLTEGRVPIARGLTTFTALGTARTDGGPAGGEITHPLTTAELPSHTHSHSLIWASVGHAHTVVGTVNQPSHTHTTQATIPGSTVSRRTGGTGRNIASDTSLTSGGADSNHFHNGTLSVDSNVSTIHLTGGPQSTLQAAGATVGVGETSHNNMQPYIVIGGWLVKYK